MQIINTIHFNALSDLLEYVLIKKILWLPFFIRFLPGLFL